MAKKTRKSGNSAKAGNGPKSMDAGEDAVLWQFVTRSIKPYTAKTNIATGAKIDTGPKVKPATPRARPFIPPAPAETRPRPGVGFDAATARKLKKGRLPIEAALDMHGMTSAEALDALRRFIRACMRDGRRTVLVITGKGNIGGGVLKRRLPEWLAEEDFGRNVVAITPAAPKDGGGGAFYLRLRKPG
jgi:DNA-nicking Smr family endonuclease